MARRITRRGKAMLSSGLHPHYVSVAQTLARFTGDEIDYAPPSLSPATRHRSADRRDRRGHQLRRRPVSRHPRPGRRLSELAERVPRQGSAAGRGGDRAGRARRDPQSPGEMGADIVVGEGQAIGVGLQVRRPLCRPVRHAREIRAPDARPPVRRDGRCRGRRGFVLTLSTREQHIRREKATSNICTNSGLCALAFSIHMTLLGEKGLRAARRASITPRVAGGRAAGARSRASSWSTRILQRIHAAAADAKRAPVVRALADQGVLAGVSLGRLYPDEPQLANGLWSSRSPKRHRGGYRGLADALAGGAGMKINASGWRPEQPADSEASGRAATCTGNRGLMLEEPLIFEIGDAATDRRRLAEPGRSRRRSPGRSRPQARRSACRASRSPRRSATTPACPGRTMRSTSGCSRSDHAP